MGQNRHKTGGLKLKNVVLQPGRGHMVGGFEQQIAGVINGQGPAIPKLADQIGGHVDVGPGDQTKGYGGLGKRLLQLQNRVSDGKAVVVVNPRQNVWRAGDGRNAVRHGHSGHSQRFIKGFRAIIDAGQKMAMQVNQTDTMLSWIKSFHCAS